MFNYFPTQRCGDSPTGWHAPCHLDDARRVDTGEHVDLAGGWHQSCDLRKWMFGTPFGLVGLSQLGLLKNPRWDRGQIADELRWGNRYFHHMVRPDGGTDGSHRGAGPLAGARRLSERSARLRNYLMIVGQAAGRPILEGQGSRP